ncbi:MAG: hypothetical protein R3E54_09925 [Halioglobus sp.]
MKKQHRVRITAAFIAASAAYVGAETEQHNERLHPAVAQNADTALGTHTVEDLEGRRDVHPDGSTHPIGMDRAQLMALPDYESSGRSGRGE